MAIKEFKGEYRFLSNFYPVDVWYVDDLYPSVEHGYQAAKTLSWEVRTRIRDAETAGKAKKLGQKVELRPGWEFLKLGIMFELVYQKFKNNPELKEKLLATGDEYLEEGNSWCDNFYGVCTCPNCQQLEFGSAKNWLGKILIEVRRILKETVQDKLQNL